MIIKLDSYKTILEKTKKKKLLLWGAGRYVYWLCDACVGIEKYVSAIIDNSEKKIGTVFEVKDCKIPVISLKDAMEKFGADVELILALKDADAVVEQLKFLELYKNVECYKYTELFQYNEEHEVHSIRVSEKLAKAKSESKIPKVIHYFWVGGNEMPENNRKCIESWKKYCPDYEIKEWNESNYDLTKNDYMYQAYQNKKWGFVPDFARLDIIYQHGGVYLDTDVEIVRNIDELLENDAFIGWESRYYANAGSGFGAVPNHPMIKEMMEAYDNVQFVNSDGSLNLVASPKFQTDVLLKHGLEKNGEYQIVNGMTVYPANCFSPKSFYSGINWKDSNTYMIHHYDATWVKGTAHDDAMQLHEIYNGMLGGIQTNVIKDDMEDLISVLVPVHNVSKYLEQCVESILKQSYKNLEIILIDDGSTDNSGELCDRYAEQYDNVSVIHKENGGLASARKAGIVAATGKYVMSVDSDDWIDSKMVEYMHVCLLDSNADFVQTDMTLEFESTGEKREMVSTLGPGIYNLDKEDSPIYKQFFVDDAGIGIFHGICGKMFKIELYRENQLAVDNLIARGEDAACVYPCYLQAQKVMITDGNFYHYRQRADSILHKSAKDLLTNWETLYNLLKEKCQFANKEINELVATNLKKFIWRRINIAIQDEFGSIIPQTDTVVHAVSPKVYGFPYRAIKKNSRVVLFGAGKVGQIYHKQIKASSYCYMVTWVDSNNYDVYIDGDMVCGLEMINNVVFDYVVIAVLREKQAREIEKTLIRMGIDKAKIIWEKPQTYYI